MTMQGIGASLSNVVAGTIVSRYGYATSHLVSGAIAVVAVLLFVRWRTTIVAERRGEPRGDALTNSSR